MTSSYLLATDGSDVSRPATEYVTETYDPNRVSIIVLGVADESKLLPYLMEDEATIGGVDLEQIRKRIKTQAENAVEDTVKLLKDAGFSPEPITSFGDPGELICDVAEERNVTGIVLGRRGRSTMGELLLGSVSHYVVHHANRPVTLVPSRSEE